MYGIIANEYAAGIKEALLDKHVIFERVGSFTPEEFSSHCAAAAAVNIDVLVVDMTSCASDSEIVRGLRKYRIARSNRVVLLAPGREPGDQAIAALVNIGIYDVVAPAIPEQDEEDETEPLDIVPYLKQQIGMSYHIGNAARWMVEEAEQPQNERKTEKPEPRQKKAKLKPLRFDDFEDDFIALPQKVVYQDRIVGSVYVGVAGTGGRTGCTFAALQVAHFLSKMGTVALVELQQTSRSLISFAPEPGQHEKFDLEGIACFPQANEDMLHRVLMSNFQYIVLDFGTLLSSVFAREFARCHVHLLTMGASAWDQDRAVECLDQLIEKGWSKRLDIIVNFATKAAFQEIAGAFSKKEKQQLNIQFHHHQLADHPLTDGEAFENILGEIGGIIPKRKRSFWRK